MAIAISSLHTEQFEKGLANWLRSFLAHDNVITLAYFQDRPPVALMSEYRHPKVYESMSTVYLTGAYLLDPFYDLHINRAPAGLYRISEIAPDQFQRNQYFLDYYRNTTLVDEIGFVAYPSPGVSLHVCLGRDGNSNRRFTSREIATARQFVPIVTSLAESHWHKLTSSTEYVEDDVTAKLIDTIKQIHAISLSPRQAEVAMLILRGHSSVSIGLRLGISSQTVKVFRKQLYRKCRISSQAELFRLLLPLLGNT